MAAGGANGVTPFSCRSAPGLFYATKKRSGFLLFGLLLTALGPSNELTGLTAAGIVLLAAGVVFLVLEIIRRNQESEL
jgi:hypothetical protein